MKTRQKLLGSLAFLVGTVGIVAMPSPAQAAVSCVSWISTNGDRGELSCSAAGGSRGYVQLEIKCTEHATTYWIESGWYPIVSGQHIRTWLSCPVGGVRGTRVDKR